MNFLAGDLRIMLLNVSEFCKNRRREGRPFPVGVNEVNILSRTAKPYDILQVEKTMLKSGYPVCSIIYISLHSGHIICCSVVLGHSRRQSTVLWPGGPYGDFTGSCPW